MPLMVDKDSDFKEVADVLVDRLEEYRADGKYSKNLFLTNVLQQVSPNNYFRRNTAALKDKMDYKFAWMKRIIHTCDPSTWSFTELELAILRLNGVDLSAARDHWKLHNEGPHISIKEEGRLDFLELMRAYCAKLTIFRATARIGRNRERQQALRDVRNALSEGNHYRQFSTIQAPISYYCRLLRKTMETCPDPSTWSFDESDLLVLRVYRDLLSADQWSAIQDMWRKLGKEPWESDQEFFREDEEKRSGTEKKNADFLELMRAYCARLKILRANTGGRGNQTRKRALRDVKNALSEGNQYRRVRYIHRLVRERWNCLWKSASDLSTWSSLCESDLLVLRVYRDSLSVDEWSAVQAAWRKLGKEAWDTDEEFERMNDEKRRKAELGEVTKYCSGSGDEERNRDFLELIRAYCARLKVFRSTGYRGEGRTLALRDVRNALSEGNRYRQFSNVHSFVVNRWGTLRKTLARCPNPSMWLFDESDLLVLRVYRHLLTARQWSAVKDMWRKLGKEAWDTDEELESEEKRKKRKEQETEVVELCLPSNNENDLEITDAVDFGFRRKTVEDEIGELLCDDGPWRSRFGESRLTPLQMERVVQALRQYLVSHEDASEENFWTSSALEDIHFGVQMSSEDVKAEVEKYLREAFTLQSFSMDMCVAILESFLSEGRSVELHENFPPKPLSSVDFLHRRLAKFAARNRESENKNPNSAADGENFAKAKRKAARKEVKAHVEYRRRLRAFILENEANLNGRQHVYIDELIRRSEEKIEAAKKSLPEVSTVNARKRKATEPQTCDVVSKRIKRLN